MNELIAFIRESIDLSGRLGGKAILTFVLVLLAILLGRLSRWLTARFTSNEKVIRRVSRTVSTLAWLAAIVLTFIVWFNALNAFLVILLVLGVIVAVSMKDLVINVFAFLYLTWTRPFSEGDRIEINGIHGVVESLGVFQMSLVELEGWLSTVTATGRIIRVANGDIFRSNYASEAEKFPYVWRELTLPIAHDSDAEEAERILMDCATADLERIIDADEERDREALDGQAALYDSTVDPLVTLHIDGQGAYVTLRYVTRFDEVAQTTTRLWKAIDARVKGAARVDYAPPSLAVEDMRIARRGGASAQTL